MRKFIVLALALIILGLVYSLFVFQSPERCFVREMKKWGEEKNVKIDSIIQADEKMAVARAKVVIDEYNLDDLSGQETRDVYMQVRTIFEYCKVK